MKKKVTHNELWAILTKREKIGMLTVLLGAAFTLTIYGCWLICEVFMGKTVDYYWFFQLFTAGIVTIMVGLQLVMEIRWKSDGRLKKLIEGN